jgi:hypothetical protein
MFLPMSPPQKVIGRSLIGTAILVYLIVLGCVIIPSNAPGKKLDNSDVASSNIHSNPQLLESLPYRGAGMQIQRVDWIDKYKKSMDEMAALGLDTVSLVIDTRQENGLSETIYLDMRMTPTPDKLAELIQHAKSKGLRVILMPIVLLDDPRGTEWRGTIKPEDWDKWFDNYRSMLNHFAWIAEQNHVDVMSVGSELVSTENKLSQWTKTIAEVRKVFHGQLTYSANWDHYTSIPFWDQLDLIGMNSYYKLGEDRNVQVPEIVDRWKDIQKDLLGFQRKVGKPLLFLEVGWCSLANAADAPWDYTQTQEDVDLDLQKRLYEGFFQAWYREPGLGGFIIWEWTPGEGGSEDKGYTPENKPAQQVLKDWLAKPWKETRPAG